MRNDRYKGKHNGRYKGRFNIRERLLSLNLSLLLSFFLLLLLPLNLSLNLSLNLLLILSLCLLLPQVRPKQARRTWPVEHIAHGANGTCMVQEVLQAVLPEWAGELTCEEELRGAETLAVRRDAGLGDCIMIQASWATLHERMPWLKITFFCPDGIRELFEPDPALADVRAYEQFTGGYDVCVDLHMYVELHPAAQIADRTALFATAFGVEVSRSPCVYLRDYELPARRKPTVAIAMYGKYAHRSWPIEHVEELGRQCIGAGYEVWYLSEFADDEGLFGPGLYCCGRSLTELATLVAGCDVVVSPDTGITHLAGALQHYGRARVVGIFGAWDPLLRIKPYRYVRYHINRDLPCVPCFELAEHLMCAPGGIDHPCMRSISAEQVFGSVQAILGQQALGQQVQQQV